MIKERMIMLIVAIVSALCVIWAIEVMTNGMAVLLVFNTLFSLYVMIFKLDTKEKGRE